MTPKDFLYRVRNLQILVFALFFILLGILADQGRGTSSLVDFKTYAKFLQELGFACIVGLVIAFALDRVSRREFNRLVQERIADIQQSVYKSTFFRDIPHELVREFEQLVLRTNFFRRDWHVSYRLNQVNARSLDVNDAKLPDCLIMQVDISSSYVVENISSFSQTFDLRIDVELPPFSKLKRFCKIQSVIINGLAVSVDQIAAHSQEHSNTIIFQKKITDVGPKQGIQIQVICQTIKLIDDVELWRSFLPSNGMTLTVYFPSTVRERGASGLHRLGVATRDFSPNFSEWVINGAILPQQGIIFWWRSTELSRTTKFFPE